jgi:putative ABC transport system permease protein
MNVKSSTPTKASRTTPVPVEVNPLESFFQELRSGKGQRRSQVATNLGSAAESVLANRVRSFLTVLGIVIGVAAVIGAITLANGVGGYFDSEIAGLGANTVLVSGVASLVQQRPNAVVKKQSHPSLTLSDLQAMSRLPHVTATSPTLNMSSQVVYGNQNVHTSIVGAGIGLTTIQNWQVAQGLWFSPAQDSGGDAVAVLGDTARQNLFGTTNINPIGQQIRIGTQIFHVIGVFTAKGGSGFGASDDSIFIPYRAFQERFTDSNYLSQIDLEADSQNNVDLVVQEITTLLESQHHLALGTPDDFSTNTSAQFLQQINVVTAGISTLLGSIATISLTVGGIGIINIMLVSVTERTREIGIRMAIGARRSDIRNQFLIEALVLCLIGGLIGMLLGILIGWLTVRVLISSLGGSGGSVPLVITPTTLILPFAVSAAVGLIFGLYPAIRASRLDPIIAIRKAK